MAMAMMVTIVIKGLRAAATGIEHLMCSGHDSEDCALVLTAAPPEGLALPPLCTQGATEDFMNLPEVAL